ncbi:type II toxin-antitoxin system VapC family toxin [Allokutzneria albata]|uniref:type II toxin-antitoxin system VapC family toxin n=1 Tax=Allokutzneria albata TaxID=211114 RepID=UPI0006935B28|nr:PIN domain-containing protein [Allokutzneria albata]
MVVDSCVIIDVLVGADDERRDRSVQTLRGHGDLHRVVLPALVLAEVAGSGTIRGDQGGINARRERIELAHEWIRDSDYLIAGITERVALRAARLATEHDLKGADACVLAVAVAWNCSTRFTWDRGLPKVGDQIPGLIVREPSAQGQGSLFGEHDSV